MQALPHSQPIPPLVLIGPLFHPLPSFALLRLRPGPSFGNLRLHTKEAITHCEYVFRGSGMSKFIFRRILQVLGFLVAVWAGFLTTVLAQTAPVDLTDMMLSSPQCDIPS